MKIMGFHIMAKLEDGTSRQVFIKDDQVEALTSCLVLLGSNVEFAEENPKKKKQKWSSSIIIGQMRKVTGGTLRFLVRKWQNIFPER